MSKSKKTAKERRIEEKKKRLDLISKKIKDKSTKIVSEPIVTEDELKETSKVITEENNISKDSLDVDSDVIRTEKSLLQKELSNIKNPDIKEIPEFLTNPDMGEERKAVMEKIQFLLKHRFSLVVIADVLECNDYDRLDKIIEQKDRIYKLTEKYSIEEGLKPIRLFSGLRRVVGEEYSRIYAEHEKRMKSAVNNILEGRYFQSQEDPEIMIEDIVSKVIDHPDFNLACQVETEFISYELDRAITILSELSNRCELQSLIEDLRKTYIEIEERSYAYKLMDKLINNRTSERTIIEKNENDDGR